MRFKTGLAVGFALGYWAATTPAEERRAKVEEVWGGVRSNPRLQRLADTVSTDVRRLGDAVEERFVSTTDSAVNAVTQGVGPSNETADTPSKPGSRSIRTRSERWTSEPGDERSRIV